jgi:hypothetical protein
MKPGFPTRDLLWEHRRVNALPALVLTKLHQT